MGTKLLPAIQVRNLIHSMLISGALPAQAADEWREGQRELEAEAEVRRGAEAGNGTHACTLAQWYLRGSHGMGVDMESWFRWAVHASHSAEGAVPLHDETYTSPRAPANFMAHQRDVTGRMRAVLIDWLCEVVCEFQLQTRTLYLAVQYLDRILAARQIARNELQLAGVLCLRVAEGVAQPPAAPLSEYAWVCDNTYELPEMVVMEREIKEHLVPPPIPPPGLPASPAARCSPPP